MTEEKSNQMNTGDTTYPVSEPLPEHEIIALARKLENDKPHLHSVWWEIEFAREIERAHGIGETK